MFEEPISYKLKLIDRKDVAYQTVEFRFEKPDGFEYQAGQSMRLKIAGIEDERTFSLLTAPHEDHLAFTMRVRGSEFKKQLKRLSIGDTVVASGPRGSFGIHKNESIPAVYIAGGIGIVIFISMLRHIVHNNLKHKITVLYSNHTLKDIAYLEELNAIETKCETIKVIPFLTQEDPHTWNGEMGRIDETAIQKYVTDGQKTLFFVTATPAMVGSMYERLLDMGIPEENIKTKQFKGY